ncbi:MAG: selenide, water dikinase SelD [Saprospiraceae bacterium]|nr:selenide, water dikinase SelD [Candidatus Vicinibacter affinis]
MNTIRLTQFSHGAGCGCKISPSVLDEILKSESRPIFSDLLVGYQQKDDAAVFDLGNGKAMISTTDFFMPIVDDAFDFGRIASVNAISDVYAMGGKPLMAIAILAWPIDKIPIEYARKVIEGARAVCFEAGIPLAGGHSIDSIEPIFGLAVSGEIPINHIKMNSGAKPGDLIYLTKGLGVGILTTAEKKSILKAEHQDLAKSSMLKLNKIGQILGSKEFVHSMTDVTGFGLCGHLLEICEASCLKANINYVKLPFLDPCVWEYANLGAVPGGTHRNWSSYGHKVKLEENSWFKLLADPQTSGGLLCAVDPEFQNQFEAILTEHQIGIYKIGKFEPIDQGNDFLVSVLSVSTES